MRKLLLLLILLAPSLAFAQTPTPVLQKFPGWKLCEDGRIGGDCVSVGPMPSLAGPLSCPLQADSTPFDACVSVSSAPTPQPTTTPRPTVTPNPPGGSSGNLQTNNGSGGFGAYAGATCPTPGFAISSSASGGWTCATPVPPTPQPTPTAGAGGGYATIQDEDSGLTQRTTLNFEGSGVTCADDTTKTTCTVPGVTGTNSTVFTASSGATNVATGATNYIAITGISSPNATENNVRTHLPAGTLSDFWCRLLSSPDNGGGTQSYVLTVRVNAADTALTCTISEADVTCAAVDTDDVAVAALQAVAISSVPSGTPSARTLQCFVSFFPS